MENKILQKLSKRGPTDFMVLRPDFPYTSEFPASYKNLLKLNLIEEKRVDNDTIVQLTLDGVEAAHKGINKWAENKVFDEIKKRKFVLTKDMSDVELNALRCLEDNEKVYEVEKRRYRVVPGKSSNQNIKTDSNESTKRVKSNNKIQTFKKNGGLLIKVLAWVFMAIIAILTILEPEYHYVSNIWKEIILHFN